MRVEAMPEISQVPVTDNTTKQLTLIWQEILGVDSITPDQNYFDLGGDSSVAVQLFAQIDKTFGVSCRWLRSSTPPQSTSSPGVATRGITNWLVTPCNDPTFGFTPSLFLFPRGGRKRSELSKAIAALG